MLPARLAVLVPMLLAACGAAAPRYDHTDARAPGSIERRLWVAADAPAGGDGSAAHPFDTIQAAVDAAGPGVAIMVRRGEYRENVRLRKGVGGAAGRPLWLLSADGAQAAHVIAADPALPAIGGGGTDHVVVAGFWITGGRNGIQFSQNGFGFTDMIGDVTIRSNLIEDVVQDGIKVNGGEDVVVSNNRIRGGHDEGIDYFAINGGRIIGNEVSDIQSPTGGISLKGGTDQVVVAHNHVHDIRSDGILIGGWSSPRIAPRPGFDSFEARRVTVEDNRIERVGKRPLNFLGAIESSATRNYLEATPGYYTVVNVAPNAPRAPRPFASGNLVIRDNVISRTDRQLKVAPGSGAVAFDNRTDTRWAGAAGADLSRYAADTPLR